MKNVNEMLSTLNAIVGVLLACLGFIVAMIENPATWLPMLIFMAGTISMIIVFNDIVGGNKNE